MASFNSAAVDIEILEKEIAAKQHDSRSPPTELTGNIAGMSSSPRPRAMQEVRLDGDLDTLDEPVWDTVRRDLRTVALKFGHVIFPSPDRQQLLKDWDLWGPLFICVGISLLLQHNSPDGSAPQFTQVFAITFFGSIVVTMNIKLLGGQIRLAMRSVQQYARKLASNNIEDDVCLRSIRDVQVARTFLG